MKQFVRALVVSSVALVSLALAGPALAAFGSPRLVIDNPNEKVSGGAALSIEYRQAREDDALFRVQIYIPQGYTTSLVPQAGQQLGTAVAEVNATQISQEAIVPVTGNIVGDTYAPDKYPQAAGCLADGSTIDGVWRLELSAAGQNLIVPAYVQAITAGPAAAFASGRLTICLPSPYAEAGPNRAALGAKLLSARMTVRNVFTNPATRGVYRWRAVATPWTVNSAVPNPPGTVETQAFDTIPVNLTVSTRVNHKAKLVGISGRLQQNLQAVPGRNVQIVIKGKVVRTVKTNGQGNFSARLKLKAGTHTISFRAIGAALPLGASGCEATFAPVPCINAMSSSYRVDANRKVVVRVR